YSGASTWSNNTVRYNISQNDGLKNSYGGITFWTIGGALSNTEVYNNIIYTGPNSGSSVRFLTGNVSNAHFRNNIFIAASGKPFINNPYSQPGIRFEGNNYWADGSFKVIWPSSTYTSLSGWQSATGQEKLNNINIGFSVDPKLVSAGIGGTIGNGTLTSLSAYQLQSDSPMKDVGLDMRTFVSDPGLRDFFGNNIPVGAFDIGAYESNSSSVATSTTIIQTASTATTSTSDIQAPSIPSSLTASPLSSSQINLTWMPSSDNVAVSGYKIYRGGIYLYTVAGTAYSDSELTANTSYTYAVSSFDAAGNNSSQTLSVQATTLSSTSTATSNKFIVGDRVKVNINKTTIRRTPAGKSIGSQYLNALGTVMGGPTVAKGNIWWDINFDKDPDGWTNQSYLSLLQTSDPLWVQQSAATVAAENNFITWFRNLMSSWKLRLFGQ
ncbi:MAG: hypothetical protein M3Q80_02375, partial [bacterium]|nr:hypothetical protein [bacterium]